MLIELVLGEEPLVVCYTIDRPISDGELATVEVLAGGIRGYTC